MTLFAIHPRKRDPYIEVNTKWKYALIKDHDKLISYFAQRFREFGK